MTTTPTASPELPDLDRLEALARAATPGPWVHRHDPGNPAGVQHGVKLPGEFGAWIGDCLDNADRDTNGAAAGERNAAFIAAANPAAVLALIALARRAKPEGEAPQAELMADANRYVYLASTADWTAIEDLLRCSDAESATELKRDLDKLIDSRLKTAITLPLYTAPAAQHADSGAQVASAQEQFDQWQHARLFANPPQSVTPYDAFVAGLAAQQDAAPGSEPMPAPVSLTARPLLYTETVNDQQVCRDDLWIVTTHVVNRAAASELVSAPGTPEAPKELGLDIAVAVNQKIGKYIAANKPALMLLNEDELAALYRFQETCEDSDSGGYDVNKEMMKRLAAIGVIESKGFGRYQFTEFGDFVIERAAQLDGGQGEGAK